MRCEATAVLLFLLLATLAFDKYIYSAQPANASNSLPCPQNQWQQDRCNAGASARARANLSFTCKLGDEVRDWFIAIKRPNSFEYAFISSKNTLNWKYARDIQSQGPVFDTLVQARQHPAHVSAYSDKPPPGQNYDTTFGHLKGLMMQGQTKGFWMMFSARHFPRLDQNILVQNKTYAQAFICITVTTTNLQRISNWLAPAMPRYYTQNQGPNDPQGGQISANDFQSNGDNSFRLFVKPKNTTQRKCIYRHISDNYSNAGGFRVQSWIRVDPNLVEANGVSHVRNIRMNVSGRPQEWQWSAASDHSKWCVSNLDESDKTVCLTDLNRINKHLQQGGAAVCFQNNSVWEAFNELVNYEY